MEKRKKRKESERELHLLTLLAWKFVTHGTFLQEAMRSDPG
jgi:hypothetical protein